MIIRKLKRFARYDITEQLLHVEALFWVSLARIAIKVFPFKKIAGIIGKQGSESPMEGRGELKKLQRLTRVIERVGRNVPFEAKCLVQAISAKTMLHYRGLDSTLYVGVAKNPGEAMRSHAWLRHGEIIITGDECLEEFKVILTFS